MDTVADLLTAILNAQRVGKERVALPYARFAEALARLLQERGLVAAVRVQEGTRPKLVLTLDYREDGQPRITGVRRLSKPGRRWYVGGSKLPYRGRRPGFYVVSTSQGLMDAERARAARLGGELVCEVIEA